MLQDLSNAGSPVEKLLPLKFTKLHEISKTIKHRISSMQNKGTEYKGK